MTPEYQYAVCVQGAEIGALLGCMPLEAVPEVIKAFLRTADPELIGAVAGQIIAYVASTATTPRGERAMQGNLPAEPDTPADRFPLDSEAGGGAIGRG